MRRIPRAIATVAVAASAFALTACGGSTTPSGPVEGSWDDVVAAAKTEGSVMLYSSQKPANLDALKAAFTQKYPEISMDFVRGTDSEINPRVETENRTGTGIADVHMVTDASWIASASESGTYSTEIVGPDFDAADYDRAASVKNDRFFLSSAAVFGLGWNTAAVPDGLETPQDILDPAYRGRIGIVNPTGIASYVDLYRHYAENYGEDYWNKLAELQPRVYPSALAVAQALTSGEVVVSPSVQPLVTEVDAGAPVDWVLPENPWGTPWYTEVLSAAPHPNAAQVLADFMVTAEGQAALNGGYAAALPDVPGAVERAQNIASPDPADLTPENVDRYSQEWSQLFQ
ncbi:extracellular solute-binding protein [Rhodococcus sp. BP-349]|uniref:ABC transporter substrate-binding protein n=1 Tax=unclassified Rhodococcus (in: high G+C Gram-positive bacteria) TaxID=192944 RepID=UPI001C9A62B3|nr:MULTISPECIES: ABC transporter substrate-binding protein [unclassified Rhodococcus (in: high G+C Gram-positive bacteria)]MBY6537993.1 extracellular solute-binding protein [Rhodococcus sp. BP-363]MBY6542330.1 extracellular solute-binding protein [Rhodococcus sp. BP-369]MBY6561560.1 extracellular solute-binding protein [Rhodococcus sp. BP-370]MBY6575852.1 extracellular solute-binding protein [Rhodococcus sp. BP-364]MBY6585153.1 extracellular solute-binding protein [Rhodococcus sp. BP-358]